MPNDGPAPAGLVIASLRVHDDLEDRTLDVNLEDVVQAIDDPNQPGAHRSPIIILLNLDQLPSVGPGNVLRDLIDSGTVRPTSRLGSPDGRRSTTNGVNARRSLEKKVERLSFDALLLSVNLLYP